MKRIISSLILALFLCSDIAMGEPIKQNALRLPMKFNGETGLGQVIGRISDRELKKLYRVSSILEDRETNQKLIGSDSTVELVIALSDGFVLLDIPVEEALLYFNAGLLAGAYDKGLFEVVCPDIEIVRQLNRGGLPGDVSSYEIFKEFADQKIEANKKLAWERMKELAQERKKGTNVFLPIIGVVPALMSYNHYRNQKYTPEEVETDANKQLEIMKWLRKVMGMKSIYWFMNLEDVWRGVYETNKDYLGEIGVTFHTDYQAYGNYEKPYLTLPKEAQEKRDSIDPTKLKKPDLGVAVSMREQIKFIRMAKKDNELKRQGIKVSAWIPAPCTLAARIYGETQFFTLLADVKKEEAEEAGEEEKVSTRKFEALMSYTYEVLREYTEALIDAGADAICLLDPSGPQILKHKYFDNERIIGDTNKIIDFIEARGIGTIYHPCGWVGACLDNKVLDKIRARIWSFGLEANNDKKKDMETQKETDRFVKNRIVEFYKRKKEAGKPVIIIGISESRKFKDLSAGQVFIDAAAVISDKDTGLAEIEEEGSLIPGTSCELLETKPDPVESLRSMIALRYGFRPVNNKIEIAKLNKITDQKLRRLERIRTQL